jgi:transposase InsO family protein
VGLSTRHERLAVVEHHSARAAGLLTERTRRRLWQARYGRTRHVEAKLPGELVCLDCFYIGKLKGVGKLWQVTACDAACSFAFAQIIPSVEAIHCARFLKRVLLPAYRKAGWKLQRVLTDGGSEFKGLFDAVCSELGIRHTRTKPRHCWTNGFVERLQGTIFHEHWRIAFRRRYFTSTAAVDRSLQSFLRFLQPPTSSPGIPPPRSYPRRRLPRCDTVKSNPLGSQKCQHPYGAGHSRLRHPRFTLPTLDCLIR